MLPPFKTEISAVPLAEFRAKAGKADDFWAIRAGSFVDIVPLHDPHNLFAEIKKAPFAIPEETVKEAMRQFMIWEPYETVAKIRNNYEAGNLRYIPTGATDLTWQTAKLIGLANRRYYSTRARTLEESLDMVSMPSGYAALASAVMAGSLCDTVEVYRMCEELWTGLNDWLQGMGISYIEAELPAL